jgi:hypothetical protein
MFSAFPGNSGYNPQAGFGHNRLLPASKRYIGAAAFFIPTQPFFSIDSEAFKSNTIKSITF